MSIMCPKCNGRSEVVDSRVSPGKYGAYRRRRVCLSCEFRYSTMEINVVEYKALLRSESLKRDLASIISDILD